jgi:Protein of unknown function (DUF2975)/Cro/C1-type HTH DNA-binding domain
MERRRYSVDEHGRDLAAAWLWIGCGQVALLAVWRLLSMVRGGLVCTRRALRWVDVIITCGAVATLVTAGVLIQMLGFVHGGGGPTVFFLAATVAAGVMVVSLVVVMRGLLVSAVADRAEARRCHLRAVIVDLDVMLAMRRMSVGDFARAVGATPAKVAVCKEGRARAIRASTLDRDPPGARWPAGRHPAVVG